MGDGGLALVPLLLVVVPQCEEENGEELFHGVSFSGGYYLTF